jgi:ribosomal-protein-alanine N-acetyltransferase
MINFRFKILEQTDLKRVLEIESISHSHPWTEKNFLDCIKASYWNYVFLEESYESLIIGHCIVMPGVEELHLLNITIDPRYRRNKIASQALIALEKIGLEKGYARVVLEVRKSNSLAIALYEKLAYRLIGARKDYYPMDSNHQSLREDAMVMEKIIR